MPAEAATRTAALIERFETKCVACIARAGPDEVHDVRVSIRRLDQGLRLFGEWVPEKVCGRIRGCIKPILRAAGAVRDCDISRQLAGELGIRLRSHTRLELQTRRGLATSYLRGNLKLVIGDELPSKWRADLKLDGAVRDRHAQFVAVARDILPDELEGFIETGGKLAHHPKSKRALHEFRISAKQLRYSLEPFADLYGPDLDAKIAAVRKVQTILGDLNDRVASRRLFKELGASSQITDAFRHAAEEKTELFRTAWQELFGEPGTSREWVRFLARVPGPPSQVL